MPVRPVPHYLLRKTHPGVTSLVTAKAAITLAVEGGTTPTATRIPERGRLARKRKQPGAARHPGHRHRRYLPRDLTRRAQEDTMAHEIARGNDPPDWTPDWATHPGEHLAETIEANGWSQAEFARLSGLTPKLVSTIIAGRNPVTPDTAVKLERVLDVKAEVWLNLQANWDLFQLRTAPADGASAGRRPTARDRTTSRLMKRLRPKEDNDSPAPETAEEPLTAAALIAAAAERGVPLAHLADPFRLVGSEGRFSWRQKGTDTGSLAAFEADAGQWIAAFRELAPRVGEPLPELLTERLRLSKRSSYEAAMDAGELFARRYQLGEVPARRLAEVMERDLGILVLMVDTVKGVSGAACHLPELDAVLINRHEVAGRRHFDLAHELFHILTWDALPPAHDDAKNEKRVEELADNFAASVLMPKAVVDRFGPWSRLDTAELVAKVNAAADALRVTAQALKWRLVSLGLITKATASGIPDDALRHNGRSEPAPEEPPPPFSALFLRVIARAIEDGHISARRAAGLLGVTLDDLPDLCAAHGIDINLDL